MVDRDKVTGRFTAPGPEGSVVAVTAVTSSEYDRAAAGVDAL